MVFPLFYGFSYGKLSLSLGTSISPQVASYQLTEDRAALALAWDAPANSVGADTVGYRCGVHISMKLAVSWDFMGFSRISWDFT